VVAGGGGIFSGPAKLAMVQPVAIAFNQSPDEVFLSPIKYMKTGDSASLDILKETLRYSSTVAALIFMV
jgi:hypothetical protein